MANYDWFRETPEQFEAARAQLKRLDTMRFVELGYPDSTLVCLLCGSIIYGTIDDKWATIHRNVCQESTSGKHRRNDRISK